MKITFIGTGGCFTMQNYQTSFVIEENGKHLLIDCGSDSRHALAASKFQAIDIDAVYITHLHSDHLGGLEWLAFYRYFSPNATRPQLIANAEMITKMWNTSLSGGLGRIQGKRTTLEDFFDVKPVCEDNKFEWEGINFEIVQTVHMSDGQNLMPSYGLIATQFPDTPEEKTVFITGDCQCAQNQILPDRFIEQYRKADLIIHDCETHLGKSVVHAHYDELKMLPIDIKSKMVLVHFGDNIIAECAFGLISASHSLEAKNDGFAALENSYGFVPCGATIDMFLWNSDKTTKQQEFPATVDEAVKILIKELTLEDKKAISQMSNDQLVGLHDTLGRAIRNRFGLWQDNKELLNDCAKFEPPQSDLVNGTIHPDDASTIIMHILRDRLESGLDN